MRLLVTHRSSYRYPKPAALGAHTIRLRPTPHARARIESYALDVAGEELTGEPPKTRWQEDPQGNRVARVDFPPETRLRGLSLTVEMAVDLRPLNPFDFFLDEAFSHVPFAYDASHQAELAPYLVQPKRHPKLAAFLDGLPNAGPTTSLIVALNQATHHTVRYVIREEAGIWTPEETLTHGRGSCRDSAVLLIAALRSRGLAARFASGYLIQLTDEGMLPDQPKGVSRDVVDLHAWAEVYLPGGGWIGLDATSGLLCGEGHIPLACASEPELAAPLSGTSDTASDAVSFSMTIGRLGHEPRPTRPYTDEVWNALRRAGDAIDVRITAADLALTMGGEPTFNSREHPEEPEWNSAALGETKWSQGLRLAAELRKRIVPGGAMVTSSGKHYPGESLPRWALTLVGRTDAAPLWPDRYLPEAKVDLDAHRLAALLASRLGLERALVAAYEDPWRNLRDEANLPEDVDPLQSNLDDPEERRRLARILDRGLGRPVGWVLPLGVVEGRFVSSLWTFRRGHLFLLQGDSPIGLRLPLASLPPGMAPPEPAEPPLEARDPRRPPEDAPEGAPEVTEAPSKRATVKPKINDVRTALTVEKRDGKVWVFLPPLADADAFLALVAAIDAARVDADVQVHLEGYLPPRSPKLRSFAVTPDPGVLEVNLPPVASLGEYVPLMELTFDAALHSGLHCEKYLLDGRMAGSGGGHHLTLGGPTALESPFVLRPDLLASLITFTQHHPSLSYLFTGLFVGPTSQAPRVDEARHDSLTELEIALAHAFDVEKPEPWLSDQLFRHLLVDVTGNTHRTELSIDKLFDWRTPHGRQGVIEFRAFEMPPHVRMAVAQMTLVRALVAMFAETPYRAPLVRFGQSLHDRYLLPHWLWRDLEDVLHALEAADLALPVDAYRPFLELRCPVAGRLEVDGLVLEVRNALEPWNVLGEEPAGGGTARYVDSSMERVELKVQGLLPGRHAVLVNGLTLPLHPTGRANEVVAGVRFRAWAPPHSLHAHIGIHHPLRIDLVDTWARRSLAACAYHVWHAEGRAFEAAPLTRFEAAARRSQRFTTEGPLPWPVVGKPTSPLPDAPWTLDLRRYPGDRPMPAA